MGEQLHILILSDRDWTHPQAGGTGTSLLSQVRRWVAWGHRVSVISCSYPGAPGREQLGAVTLHRLGGRSTVFPRAIWRQWRGLVPDADVLLEVFNGVTFLTPVWCRTPRVTLIQHIHRDHYRLELPRSGRIAALALETLPLKLLYRRSQIETISEASAWEIARHGIDPRRIKIAHPGIDVDALTPDPSARAPEPTLLYLGRLKRYKRIELVLDVLAAQPGATLDIAGDGDHRSALLDEIAARGLTERVRLHGFVSEQRKLELYRRAWINLTASSSEGWGLSVTEAGACGTPTAALRVGGLAECIVDGETGLLASDATELSARVAMLLADPQLREQLGRRAREHATQFSWDAMARTTLALLDAERRRARPGVPVAAGLGAPHGQHDLADVALR